MAQRKSVLLEFIQLYRDLPILWDTNHNFYNNCEKRASAYSELIEKYKCLEPSANSDSVVKKNKFTATNFRKEIKKVKESKRSRSAAEETYEPSLWYFNELLFLLDQETPESSRSTFDGAESGNDENVLQEDPSASIQHQFDNIPIPKKRKSDGNKTAVNMFNLALKHLEQEDEYLITAKGYANKLKKMEPVQRLYADRLINEVLLRAQLGKLDEFSNIICSVYSRSTSVLDDSSSTSIHNHYASQPHLIDLRNTDDTDNLGRISTVSLENSGENKENQLQTFVSTFADE